MIDFPIPYQKTSLVTVVEKAIYVMQGITEKEAWQRSNNVSFEGEDMRDLRFEVFNILSEEMKDCDAKEVEAEFQAMAEQYSMEIDKIKEMVL